MEQWVDAGTRNTGCMRDNDDLQDVDDHDRRDQAVASTG